ncbi:12481_t:CDS:2 [Gigaspora margarita]|uniref:12481_t:CDS:1 n=1 Tax=Gigaspora margarita TaxID=4874 RepID=A0ABM8VVR3_GIGMA|nr:12481_t:CDS:2 [Gigaspora margarita]
MSCELDGYACVPVEMRVEREHGYQRSYPLQGEQTAHESDLTLPIQDILIAQIEIIPRTKTNDEFGDSKRYDCFNCGPSINRDYNGGKSIFIKYLVSSQGEARVPQTC